MPFIPCHRKPRQHGGLKHCWGKDTSIETSDETAWFRRVMVSIYSVSDWLYDNIYAFLIRSVA